LARSRAPAKEGFKNGTYLEVEASSRSMANLTNHVTAGERLVEEARGQRIADYGTRCEAWAREVEQTLADKPLELARFRQAQPTHTPHPGITYGVMSDFALLRGRLAVLTEIEDAAKESRRETLRFWLVVIFGIIGACIGAWAIVEGWLTN
jgi:hypothetical protein